MYEHVRGEFAAITAKEEKGWSEVDARYQFRTSYDDESESACYQHYDGRDVRWTSNAGVGCALRIEKRAEMAARHKHPSSRRIDAGSFPTRLCFAGHWKGCPCPIFAATSHVDNYSQERLSVISVGLQTTFECENHLASSHGHTRSSIPMTDPTDKSHGYCPLILCGDAATRTTLSSGPAGRTV